jgi:hypothetical protein
VWSFLYAKLGTRVGVQRRVAHLLTPILLNIRLASRTKARLPGQREEQQSDYRRPNHRSSECHSNNAKRVGILKTVEA